MRELFFYGGTVLVWTGLIGAYMCMKKLRTEHSGMNFHRMRILARDGNDTAKRGVTLVVVAAFGVAAQLASFVMDGSL